MTASAACRVPAIASGYLSLTLDSILLLYPRFFKRLLLRDGRRLFSAPPFTRFQVNDLTRVNDKRGLDPVPGSKGLIIIPVAPGN